MKVHDNEGLTGKTVARGEPKFVDAMRAHVLNTRFIELRGPGDVKLDLNKLLSSIAEK